jgi:hypothetical protein
MAAPVARKEQYTYRIAVLAMRLRGVLDEVMT